MSPLSDPLLILRIPEFDTLVNGTPVTQYTLTATQGGGYCIAGGQMYEWHICQRNKARKRQTTLPQSR